MKKEKNKKITLEKLSNMMESGFELVLEKIEKTATKEQVQKIDERLKVVEEKVDRLEGIPARVKTLEGALEIG
jgi:hypothetical protein